MSAVDWAIAGPLRHWVTRKPNDPCMTVENVTLTWRELFERACRVGQGLLATGLRPQDRVLYLGKNGAEFFEILNGAAMAGGVTGAVNWRLAPREMLFIIDHSRAGVLFIEAEFLGHLQRIRDDLTSLKTVVVIGDGDGAAPHEVDAHAYEQWLGRQATEDPAVAVTADDIGLQMYTSGTTGLPKGAMFSNRAVRAIRPMAELTRVSETSVVMVAMPVFHAAGSSLGTLSLAMGAHTVIVREVDPAEILSVISRHRVTMTTIVPTVLKMMLETPALAGGDLSSLDTIAYAASPISPDSLRASLAAFRCRFVQIYGMTETNGVTALLPEDHLDPRHPERMLSGGRPIRDVSLRIVDPSTGRDAGEGEFGEVWIKAPTNMDGYFEAAAETAATMTSDGYVRTGDGGHLTGGYLYLKDRIKDMIVSGGENVYSVEVENVLLAHPRISDAAVIGVPSDKWGESVKAIVMLRPGDDGPDEADVIDYARANLARYKCPTSVEFVDELPRNPSGKILKRALRERFPV